MFRSIPLALFALLVAQAPQASAQFNLFDQFFGGAFGGHQQQPQRGPAGRPNTASMWAAQADAVACATYLCPDTLVCVTSPSDCPCPNAEDVKCLVPDAHTGQATVLCVRGSDGCALVEKLTKPL